ncbi:MAG: hypothetical protein K9G46_07070 [Flavobacteriales bacterium]|nr:hypothetical protein [Flavobacteriales bacterium]
MKKLIYLLAVASVAISGCKKECTDPGFYKNCDEWRDAITGTWNGQANCGGTVVAKTDYISNGGSITTILWSEGFTANLTSGNSFVIPQQTVYDPEGQTTIQYSGFGTYSSTALNYTLYAQQGSQSITCTQSAGR